MSYRRNPWTAASRNLRRALATVDPGELSVRTRELLDLPQHTETSARVQAARELAIEAAERLGTGRSRAAQ